MMLIGLGAEAAVLTGGGHFGDFAVITLGWGLGVTCAVYVSARLSGPHLNPALTIGLAVCRKFPWRKVLPFIAAQLAGGFVAALIVRAGYSELILQVRPGHDDQEPAGVLHAARQRAVPGRHRRPRSSPS